MELEDLIKKIDANLVKINENAQKIEDNFQTIQQNRYALDILKDYKESNQEIKESNRTIKGDNKKLFVIIIIVLSMWFVTIGYLVYVLNDISNVETSEDIIEIEGVEKIDNSHIKIGDDIWEKSE